MFLSNFSAVAKMKTVLLLLAVVGVSFAAPGARSLSDDYSDLVALLPFDELGKIEAQHLLNDPALATVVDFLHSKEWQDFVNKIGGEKYIQQLGDYFDKAGIPIAQILKNIDNEITQAKSQVAADPDASLASFLTDIEGAISLTKLLGFLNQKLQSSPDTQKLYVLLASEDTKNAVEEILAYDEAKTIKQRLVELSVDVDYYVKLVYDFLGWGKPPASKRRRRSLTDDFNDLLDILPFADFERIENQHLSSDGAFVDVIEYLQGKEWQDLVKAIGGLKGIQQLGDYFDKAGIPVGQIQKAIDDVIASAKPQIAADPNGSLESFLDDVQSVLPLTKLLSFVNVKLQSSPDVQKLYVQLSSEDTKALLEGVLKDDQVQFLRQRLIDLGVGVDDILGFVYDFLGWGKIPSP